MFLMCGKREQKDIINSYNLRECGKLLPTLSFDKISGVLAQEIGQKFVLSLILCNYSGGAISKPEKTFSERQAYHLA